MAKGEEVSINPKPEGGQVWRDKMYGEEVTIKYADEEVVLVQTSSENHTVYDPKYFRNASKRSLINNQNRFKKINNDS